MQRERSIEQKQAMREVAEKTIKEIEKQLNQSLGEIGQDEKIEEIINPNPEKEYEPAESSKTEVNDTAQPSKSRPNDSEYAKKISEMLKNYGSEYQKVLSEVAPLIDQLETRLREIFHARRTHGWQSGYRRGKRIDIRRRMQEKAQGTSAVDSKAWQRREAPTEKDYAISLLVDLSGSMQGQKINQTFRAVVVAAEALNRIGISSEILGFHDELREYKQFSTSLSSELRAKMDGIVNEVTSPNANYNDDGWALEQTARRLATQPEQEKFILAFSDGQPAESPSHSGSEYDLSTVITSISKKLPIKLVGLGIGPGTGHVENYYPNSIANVSLEQMVTSLSDLIEDMIENPDSY
jgi:cobalamin biosynthesis protein CobT